MKTIIYLIKIDIKAESEEGRKIKKKSGIDKGQKTVKRTE